MCLFIGTKNKSGNFCHHLVKARSRVASMKTISIHRLKLLTFKITARLANNVKTDLKLEDIDIIAGVFRPVHLIV